MRAKCPLATSPCWLIWGFQNKTNAVDLFQDDIEMTCGPGTTAVLGISALATPSLHLNSRNET